MVLVRSGGESQDFLRSCLVEGDRESEERARHRRQRALAFSVLLQIIVISLLVLVPVLGQGEHISLQNMTPLPPYARFGGHPPSLEGEQTPRPSRPTCAFCVPSPIPPTIVTHDGTPGRLSDVNSDDSEISRYGHPDSHPNGLLHSESARGPAPAPPEEKTHNVNQTRPRRTVSESVQAAQLFHRVEPIYPPLAKQLRREGRVELHAIIGTDGTIQSLEVISGDPLLIRSALDAVREWRYHPTLLNGQPVEVETHITVIYSLSR